MANYIIKIGTVKGEINYHFGMVIDTDHTPENIIEERIGGQMVASLGERGTEIEAREDAQRWIDSQIRRSGMTEDEFVDEWFGAVFGKQNPDSLDDVASTEQLASDETTDDEAAISLADLNKAIAVRTSDEQQLSSFGYKWSEAVFVDEDGSTGITAGWVKNGNTLRRIWVNGRDYFLVPQMEATNVQ